MITFGDNIYTFQNLKIGKMYRVFITEQMAKERDTCQKLEALGINVNKKKFTHCLCWTGTHIDQPQHILDLSMNPFLVVRKTSKIVKPLYDVGPRLNIWNFSSTGTYLTILVGDKLYNIIEEDLPLNPYEEL